VQVQVHPLAPAAVPVSVSVSVPVPVPVSELPADDAPYLALTPSLPPSRSRSRSPPCPLFCHHPLPIVSANPSIWRRLAPGGSPIRRARTSPRRNGGGSFGSRTGSILIPAAVSPPSARPCQRLRRRVRPRTTARRRPSSTFPPSSRFQTSTCPDGCSRSGRGC
jgi:hypothetical protein